MNNIILDTNVLISIIDENDKWFKTTKEILTNLPENTNFIILDIVINESINVLAKRFESKNQPENFIVALSKMETVYFDKILWVSEYIKSYHFSIMTTLKEHKGLLNYNDSFIINYMLNNNLSDIFSYDEDFDLIPSIKRISNSQRKLTH
ncbi:MAG: type II toxin-antitoxin system VapC family toxin [bacterium]